MTFRHSAALALAGWYLMLAPYHSGMSHDAVALGSTGPTSTVFDFDAQLSKWDRGEIFDSAADCDREKNKLYHQRLTEFKQATKKRSKRTLGHEMVRFQYARCIASDDPRLAK